MQHGSPEGGTAVYAELVQKVRFGTTAGAVVDHSTLAVDANVDELDVQRHSGRIRAPDEPLSPEHANATASQSQVGARRAASLAVMPALF
jgi:hypothetical protein